MEAHRPKFEEFSQSYTYTPMNETMSKGFNKTPIHMDERAYHMNILQNSMTADQDTVSFAAGEHLSEEESNKIGVVAQQQM